MNGGTRPLAALADGEENERAREVCTTGKVQVQAKTRLMEPNSGPRIGMTGQQPIVFARVVCVGTRIMKEDARCMAPSP